MANDGPASSAISFLSFLPRQRTVRCQRRPGHDLPVLIWGPVVAHDDGGGVAVGSETETVERTWLPEPTAVHSQSRSGRRYTGHSRCPILSVLSPFESVELLGGRGTKLEWTLQRTGRLDCWTAAPFSDHGQSPSKINFIGGLGEYASNRQPPPPHYSSS